MEVWQEIAKNAERGAERLVAEHGDGLHVAATLLCRNNGDAEELVFRTLAQAVGKIRQIRETVVRPWRVRSRVLHGQSGCTRLLACSTAESMSEFFKTIK